MEKKHIIMLLVALIILIIPLALFNGKNTAQGSFVGSDDQGTAAIEQQGYHPWLTPIWTPPSSEIETLLFSVQAAIGAGIIGYFLGYYRSRRKFQQDPKLQEKEKQENEK